MTRLKALLFGSFETNSRVGDATLAFARASIGLLMLIGHGFGKLNAEGFAKLVKGTGAMGFPMPTVFAGAAVAAETLFALLVAVGLLTRFSSAVLAFNMLVAAFIAHGAHPWFGAPPSKEPAILYLLPFLVFAVLGGGRYSVDRFAR